MASELQPRQNTPDAVLFVGDDPLDIELRVTTDGTTGQAEVTIHELLLALRAGGHTTGQTLKFSWPQQEPKAPVTYTFADNRISFTPAANALHVDGTPKIISPIGYQLLNCLVSRLDTTVSKDELLEGTWLSRNNPAKRYDNLSTQISYLRQLFGSDLKSPRLGPLRTVRSYGYKLLSHLEAQY